mmetsp:Transcript_7514/g.18496  ORF Transcript_7514/g.18496 Transcript_7514/m.18496 type:complete len:85 (-) Transcript_7514:9-263(-)
MLEANLTSIRCRTGSGRAGRLFNWVVLFVINSKLGGPEIGGPKSVGLNRRSESSVRIVRLNQRSESKCRKQLQPDFKSMSNRLW